MAIPNEVVALLLATAFLVAAYGLMVRSGRGRAGSDDLDPAHSFGFGLELLIGVFASARLGAPGYILLGFVGLLPVAVGGHRSVMGQHVAQGLLAVIAVGAAIDAQVHLFVEPCSAAIGTIARVATGAVMAVAIVTYTLRTVLGGWLRWTRDLGTFALAVFALGELAPTAIAPGGVPLVGAYTGAGWSIALVGLLMVVAAGVGIRPRFSIGILGLAMSFLTLGLLAAPSECLPSLGNVVTAALVAGLTYGLGHILAH